MPPFVHPPLAVSHAAFVLFDVHETLGDTLQHVPSSGHCAHVWAFVGTPPMPSQDETDMLTLHFGTKAKQHVVRETAPSQMPVSPAQALPVWSPSIHSSSVLIHCWFVTLCVQEYTSPWEVRLQHVPTFWSGHAVLLHCVSPSLNTMFCPVHCELVFGYEQFAATWPDV